MVTLSKEKHVKMLLIDDPKKLYVKIDPIVYEKIRKYSFMRNVSTPTFTGALIGRYLDDFIEEVESHKEFFDSSAIVTISKLKYYVQNL